MEHIILGKLLKLGRQDSIVKPPPKVLVNTAMEVCIQPFPARDVCIRGGLVDGVALGIRAKCSFFCFLFF